MSLKLNLEYWQLCASLTFCNSCKVHDCQYFEFKCRAQPFSSKLHLEYNCQIWRLLLKNEEENRFWSSRSCSTIKQEMHRQSQIPSSPSPMDSTQLIEVFSFMISFCTSLYCSMKVSNQIKSRQKNSNTDPLTKRWNLFHYFHTKWSYKTSLATRRSLS
jgi:hypothetical protein